LLLYINRRCGRTGTLWEGRFKANPVQQDANLLTCYRCIELNPVRAGMLDDPADYRWSSYGTNALGKTMRCSIRIRRTRPLGANDLGPYAAYRELFAAGLGAEKRKPCSRRPGRARTRFQR
jgi:putative transposase